ncbi:putative short-chain dehydrogenase [Colletotrichum phormii]|uniref:Short-chain dehydrogenase n=1 Tax=Colletotrichum phormii TaxID=359342 RepID=A0AAJ0E9N7_9PEZI|nr:putative short-chain dehydrogenase [Colletotrichum phormii]KAK1621872.1 putative short-chain dehydrogenase [Colletotrichum phormii]
MNTDKRTVGELATLYATQIKGKVILTTGVSPGGVGAGFVTGIAKAQPALLILAGRNRTKVDQTAQTVSSENPGVEVRVLDLDLASLDSVKAASAAVNGWDDVPRIDVLVNNAAVMAVDWKATPEGLDSQLVTNYLGPFLFTNLIMGKILQSPAPPVVNVTSDGHRLGPVRFDDYNFQDGENYNKWQSYGQSKTAVMLNAISLAEKLGSSHNLAAFSAHPGLVMSNLGSHLKMFGESTEDFVSMIALDRLLGNMPGFVDWSKMNIVPDPPEVGANILAYRAFDPELSKRNGQYILSGRVADPFTDTVKPWATSSVEAEKLWKLSEKLVGQEFSY